MKGPVPRTGAFWAKLERDAEGRVVAWHPFVDHCVDVALAAEALLRLPTWRARLSALAGRPLGDVDVARLAYIAGLHDAGKLGEAFQRRAWKEQPGGHTEPGLALLVRPGPITELAVERVGAWGNAVLALWWAALCHHGRLHGFDSSSGLGGAHRSAFAPREGADPVGEFGRLLDALDAAFPIAHADRSELPDTAALHHAYAGLVMLADWLGSDTTLCPYRSSEQEDRVPLVRGRLEEHVVRSGLDARLWRDRIPPRVGLRDLVGEPWNERGAQAVVRDLSLPDDRGSVTLVEAETGSGKTEAALIWWARLARAGLVDGVYFALPLRSAAVQLHRRVYDAARCLLGEQAPPVLLAVPGYLRVDDLEGVGLAPFRVLWNDQQGRAQGGLERDPRTWAAERPKRYLTAPIAVGTIDQVLLSTLPLPHAHLRATSGLRNLLVVDEVHASDRYMERLLGGVVERFRAAGGHVLLLSATLGESARRRLLGTVPLSEPEAVATPYPAVWVRSGGEVALVESPHADGARDKRVAIDLFDAVDDVEAVASLAVAAVRRGERVLVIVNRVERCQDVHAAAVRMLGERAGEMVVGGKTGRPAPHHSRYARPDREILDAAVEARFGKQAGPGPALVVATQTVEQSLDIDADLLITDLCPIDVLLQRIGRLHRHRERGIAPCVVLSPGDDDLAALAGSRRSHPSGLGTVYPDLCALIATRRLIEERPEWSIPSDNRMLVERGTHPDALRAIADESDALLGAFVEFVGEKGAMHSLASSHVRAVEWSRDFLECGFPSRIDGVGERVGTRWSVNEDDRLLEVAPAWESPLGGRVRELRIPGHLCRGGDPVLLERGGDFLTVGVGSRTLRYGGSGIEREG